MGKSCPLPGGRVIVGHRTSKAGLMPPRRGGLTIGCREFNGEMVVPFMVKNIEDEVMVNDGLIMVRLTLVTMLVMMVNDGLNDACGDGYKL